jgi:tetratricopeptide (TPR) repeat protein
VIVCHFQCLMGEANLRYARGDLDTAVRMCMEVIKEDPSAPEPFQTLAALYEDSGEQDRSLQYALIAAHLAPQDPEEWARLADMSTGTMTRCFRALIFVLCTYVTPATCNDLLGLLPIYLWLAQSASI